MSDVFGKKLGNYVLLEQLGEGGMAKVYNAYDPRAERNVAIKVILPNKRNSQMFLQQFETEAKALANLTHTNIVKVFNYGVEDGQPYLVMDFVPAGTLKESMNRPIPWQTAAATLAPIARALDYVHNQQIVHRDVKPSNILLYEDFRPMLSDFGIVKLLEAKEEGANSAIGVGVGTPEYMSPEQGMGKEVDFRADIYSLGLVFYEMLTGVKPFTADTPMAAILRHITDDLPLPSKLNRAIPKFVEKAVLRAVQKDPKDRYLSMGDFAEALEMISLGEDAPEKKILELSKPKIIVRKRKPNYLFMLIALMIVFAGVYLVTSRNFLLALPDATPVSTAVKNNSAGPSPAAATAIPTLAATATTVPQTIQQMTSLAKGITLLGTPLTSFRPAVFGEIARWGIGGVNVVEWSPNGRVIALGTTSGIFLYEAGTNNLIRFINTEFDVVEMTFSPDGEVIVAGTLDGTVKAWNASSGEFERSFTYVKPAIENLSPERRVNVITYSQNGKNIAIGYADGTIDYFSVDLEKPTMVVGQYPAVEDLVISGDNRILYASNGSNDLFVWDVATQKEIKEISFTSPLNKLKLSQNRQFLFSSGGGNQVYMVDLFEERIVSSFLIQSGLVADFDVSYDDTMVVIGLNTGEIKVFEIPGIDEYSQSHQPLQVIKGSGNKITSLAFSPEKLMVASGTYEGGLEIWDVNANNAPLFTLGESMAGVNAIYFSKNGSWLATSHEDGVIRVWDVEAAVVVYQLEGSLPKGMPFSPNDQFLAIMRKSERNKTEAVQILDLDSGKIIADLMVLQTDLFAQFSEDSQILVTGDPFNANIWDVLTWEQVNSHGGMHGGCGQYFTPQNGFLAVISNAGVLFAETANIEEMCITLPKGAELMYYFPSNHKAFFVLADGSLFDYDFRLPERLNRIFHADNIYPFARDVFIAGDQESGWYAYSPDGKKLMIMAGRSETISKAQNDYLYRVALSPDHKLMALGSKYGSIHIWTTP